MMLKNLTLGQYIPGDSFLHRANPKVKLVFSFCYVVLLFFVTSFVSFGFCTVLILALYFACKFPMKLMFNNLKAIFLVLVIATVFNLFFVRSGDVIFKFFFFKITTDSVLITLRFVCRIFLLITGSSLLTYTTLSLDLTLAIEELLRPLSKFRVPVSEISIMMSIALRFIPLLISESQIIMAAQKSRGLSIQNQSGVLNKLKAVGIFLVPLLVSAFKKANELAISMEARCFRVGFARTRYKELKMKRFDIELAFGCVVFLSVALILNFYIKV